MEELAKVADGNFDTSSSVPYADCDEPAPIPKAVEATEGEGADACGWDGCYERSVRSWLREQ